MTDMGNITVDVRGIDVDIIIDTSRVQATIASLLSAINRQIDSTKSSFETACASLSSTSNEAMQLIRSEALKGAGGFAALANGAKAVGESIASSFADASAQDSGGSLEETCEKSAVKFERLKSVAGSLATGMSATAKSIGAASGKLVKFAYDTALSGDSLKTMAGEFTASMATLTNNLPALAAEATAVLPQLVSSIASMGPGLVSAVSDVVVQMAAFIPQFVPIVLAALPGLVASLVEGIAALAPALVEGATQLFLGLVQALNLVIPIIMESLPGLLTSTCEALIAALPLVLEAGIQLFTGLVQALPEILPLIAEQLPLIVSSIVAALSTQLPLLIEGALAFFLGIVQALPQIIPPLLEALPTVVSALVGLLPTLVPALVAAAVQLFMALVDALPLILPQLLAAVPAVISAVVSQLPTLIPALLAAAVMLFLAIVEAVPKILGDLQSAVKSLIDQGIEKVKSFASSMGDAGLQLIQGLVDGVKGAGKWVIDAVGRVVTDAIDGAKKLLGIASPSKVFAEFGRYVSLGLAKGIDDEASSAVSATKSMLHDMTAAARSGLSTLRTPIGMSLDGVASFEELLEGFRFEAAFRTGSHAFSTTSPVDPTGRSAVIGALREVKESIEGFRAGIGREIAVNAPSEIEATIANPRAFARALNR